MTRPQKQEQEAATDDVAEVGPGVLRMQLPISLPGLGHVNTYALIDKEGAAIVDPGLPGPASWKALKQRLRTAGIPLRRIHTVIVTHSHPDHFGGSGRLAKESGGRLVAHAAFRTPFQTRVEDPCVDLGDDVEVEDLALSQWSPVSPWGRPSFRPPLIRRLQLRAMRRGLFSSYVEAKPTGRVRHGEVIRLAGRDWTAIHTPGHTLDHLCLHDPEEGLLLAGDHVLPSITPHIAGQGGGRDPLKAFFASLDRVAALPNVKRALPAHGHPFADVPGRVAAIKKHHEERIAVLQEAVGGLGPASVEALSHELFRQAHWGAMAESETYAHLEHLRLLGEVTRSTREGLAYYELARAERT